MNTTLVTALYDIGRGNWNNVFQRSHNEYIEYFKNILSLDAHLSIYIDEKDLEAVRLFRSKIDPNFKKTIITLRPFVLSEAFQKFYIRCKNVMSSSEFLKNRVENHTPEMIFPEYNIINFNKLSFIEDRIKNNIFKSDYFIWIDAGFYHNRFPKEYLYKPYPNPEKIKVLDDNKVHFLTLSDQIELSSYFDPRVSIAGSMFAGKSEPLIKLKELCYDVIDEFLNANAINDDQTIYAFAYQKNPSLFNLTQGDWFQNFYDYI